MTDHCSTDCPRTGETPVPATEPAPVSGAECATRRGPARVGTKVQIRLPEDTLERIDSCAADLGVSRAEYIRRALAVQDAL